MKSFFSSGTSSSAWIESEVQAGMHAPQSMQPSGSTDIWVAASKPGSLLGMYAIGRANLYTEGVFNARISNYIGHDEISLLE